MNMKLNFHKQITLTLLIILTVGALTGCAASELIPAFPSGEASLTGAEGSEGGENILLLTEVAIGLLLVASLVGIVARRLRVPYTVGLVLIGMALSLPGQVSINVSPELFLGLLVPPLIFEAAFHIRAKDLLQDLIPIVALAIPGVLITTILVGSVVAWGTGFPLAVALVFGSLVAAIDPVAVVSLFRALGVPTRLQVLLEGESLFNDGTAIVLFNLMLAVAISGVIDPLGSVIDFFVVSGGGLAVGFVLGVMISQAIGRIDDSLIETTLTTVLAFGAYIGAEQLHVSGVLAVVAAGLVSGNIGPQGMSASSRIFVFNFWEYAAFLANSFVFLLIGLQINLQVMFVNWNVIVWAILAVLVARAVSVFGLSWLGSGVPRRYKMILYWGGLRGAISLALALSLPTEIGVTRSEIQTMAFGVVLFTLLVQGLTMKPLIQKMGLLQRSEAQEEYERRHSRAVMARSAYERLQKMHREGLLSSHTWEALKSPLKQHAEALALAVTEALHADPKVEAEEFDFAMRELLTTQRSALTNLLRNGIISEETYSHLVGEVDIALVENRSELAELLRNKTHHSISGLMVMIIQETDIENVIATLNRLGLPVTRMSSTGGFLGTKNITLLIGVPEGQEATITSMIEKASRQRVRQLPSLGTEKDASIAVGGAKIFAFEVEHYEEI